MIKYSLCLLVCNAIQANRFGNHGAGGASKPAVSKAAAVVTQAGAYIPAATAVLPANPAETCSSHSAAAIPATSVLPAVIPETTSALPAAQTYAAPAVTSVLPAANAPSSSCTTTTTEIVAAIPSAEPYTVAVPVTTDQAPVVVGTPEATGAYNPSPTQPAVVTDVAPVPQPSSTVPAGAYDPAGGYNTVPSLETVIGAAEATGVYETSAAEHLGVNIIRLTMIGLFALVL